MALLTAAETRAHLPQLAGTALDAELATLVAHFDAIAAEYCGFPASPGGTVGAARTLESATYTLYLDGPDPSDPSLLWVGVRPITAVSSIYSDPVREYGSGSLVASGDYTLHGGEGMVMMDWDSGDVWDSGSRAIKIAFTAGFSTVPAPIKRAAGLQVASWFKNRPAVGARNVSQQGTSIGYASPLELLPEVKQLLSGYVLAGGSIG